jgi:hypothetical protein
MKKAAVEAARSLVPKRGLLRVAKKPIISRRKLPQVG